MGIIDKKIIVQIVSPLKGEGHIHERVGKMRICMICNDHFAYNESREKKMRDMGIIHVTDDGVLYAYVGYILMLSKNIHNMYLSLAVIIHRKRRVNFVVQSLTTDLVHPFVYLNEYMKKNCTK